MKAAPLSAIRHHADTDVGELVGRLCEQLVAVPLGEELLVFYARADGVWHRFFLEAGLLVWREGGRPDRAQDLHSDESYRDLAAELNVLGAAFTSVGYHDGVLELRFANGAYLVCTEGERGAKVVEKGRGKLG